MPWPATRRPSKALDARRRGTAQSPTGRLAPGGIARPHARRERGAGARAEPRHPGVAARAAVGRPADGGIPEHVSAGLHQHVRPAGPGAASDQPVEWRRQRDQRHHHLQLRLNQSIRWGGGSYLVGFTNSRLGTNNLFANFNPVYNATLTAAYSQPILRGFRIDNTRQQIQVSRAQPRDFRAIGQGHGDRRRWRTCGTPTGISSSPAAPSTSRAGPWTCPRGWSRTTRRGSKSGRSPRSTSCRRRPKRPPGGRPSPRPRPRRPPPISR